MDRSRKQTREVHEKTIGYKSPQDARLEAELIEEKLTKLLAFIGDLKRTPEGTSEIERRTKLFGECKRTDGETSVEFYAKLRRWLDRDIPQTKSPLHPPRQIGGGRTP